LSGLGVLTGLRSEARLVEAAGRAAGLSVRVAVGGLDRAAAAERARQLAAAGPELMVSFGLAGGLRAGLAPGALVCPAALVPPTGARRSVPFAGRAALVQALDAAADAVAASDAPVADPAAKRALAARTQAGIVDMESHLLAEAAEAAGRPWLVLRAVCDPVERGVPAAVTRALGADGRVRPAALPGLLAHPLAVARLARDSRHAHRALARAAQALCRQLAA
jgi:adenosylhomocysteine nucleosidase